jgi:molybdopterin-guanine dinucleotide biosynthesis protein A
VPLAERIVRSLRVIDVPVTVLGREPVEGAEFLADSEQFAGPLAALSHFRPSRELVFVVSCDVPRFDASLVKVLEGRMGEHEAVVPVADGWRQPLCALYRASAFERLATVVASGRRSVMAWVDALRVVEVDEEELASLGVDPDAVRGVNTPEELQRALGAG